MESEAAFHGQKGQRALLTSLLLSAPGPLVTGIAMFSSGSVTQVADFLRRSTELLAILVSYGLYRKLQREQALAPQERARLERLCEQAVGGAMLGCGALMLLLAMLRFGQPAVSGNSVMGLVIALLGLLSNGLLWLRYRALTKARHDAVLVTQQKLYRAKTFVDFCVSAALLMVALAPDHPATPLVDSAGSAIVACYLGFSGLSLLRRTMIHSKTP